LTSNDIADFLRCRLEDCEGAAILHQLRQLLRRGAPELEAQAARVQLLAELVAQELFNLEVSAAEIKVDLSDLYINAAKQIEVSGGRKAIMIFVPFRMLKSYHRIQQRLVRELEKKFSGRHIVIIAQRTILGKSFSRSKKVSGPRPRSRTLTKVHEAILEDLVYPTEIVGKRTVMHVDGSRQLKVYLDPKDQVTVETKLDTFAQVYKRLTSKDVVFEFPVTKA